jgi:hypothetical protein
MNQNSTELITIFVPVIIKQNEGNMNILGALNFVQAQTGMCFINEL